MIAPILGGHAQKEVSEILKEVRIERNSDAANLAKATVAYTTIVNDVLKTEEKN